jgi:putative hydrolase of the HAD superfamily
VSIKAVSFDFWSTLFALTEEKRSWLVVKERMLMILAEYNIKVNGEDLLVCFRKAMDITLDKQENHGLEFPPEEQLAYILDCVKVKPDRQMFERLYQPYTRTLLDVPPKLMEGAKELIYDLSETYPLALICNTGRTPGTVIREIMGQEGILNRFKVVHFSNELGIAKPNPDIYRQTLAKLDFPAEQVVHIGDNPLTDVWGAKSMGMKAVWFNWRKEDKEVDCDLEIDSLLGLKEKIMNL